MKNLLRFLPLAACLLLPAFQAHADWWYWHRPYRPAPVVVVEAPPAYVVEPGYHYRHSVAVDVQIALKRRGYYRGPLDGDIGPSSRASIRSYQYDHRLRVNGLIDRQLLRSLGL